jgi:uncharacterized membrane protein YecN with MAPEG domain
VKSKSRDFFLFLLVAFGLQGCANPDPTPYINNIGIYLLIGFCFVVTLSLCLPHLQKTKMIQLVRQKLRIPLIAAGYITQIVGIILIVSFSLQQSTYFLLSLVGVIFVVGGYFWIRWAKSTSDAPSSDLKIVGLSVSFIIAILWLIFSAEKMIKF